MRISILVANSKGGCGKTTMATNLAGAFARGGLKTMIADVDKQKSSLNWLKRRSDGLPLIDGVDWTREIIPVKKRVQRLVIDAPAAISVKRFSQLLKMADLILLPVLPSAFDQAATKKFLKKVDDLKPIRKNRKPVGIVANKVRARTRACQELEAFLATLGHPVVTRLADRAVYTDAAYSGESIFDRLDRVGRTAQEDWSALLTHVETS